MLIKIISSSIALEGHRPSSRIQKSVSLPAAKVAGRVFFFDQF